MCLRNQLGKNFTPKELEAAGFVLSPANKKCSSPACVLVALLMGSLHAVDVSQDFHEGIILSEKYLLYHDFLHYGFPICLWSQGDRRLYQGLHVDDNALVARVKKSDLGKE